MCVTQLRSRTRTSEEEYDSDQSSNVSLEPGEIHRTGLEPGKDVRSTGYEADPGEDPNGDLAKARNCYADHLRTHWAYCPREKLLALTPPSADADDEEGVKLSFENGIERDILSFNYLFDCPMH